MGIKKGANALWYSELSLHQLGSRPTVFTPRWATAVDVARFTPQGAHNHADATYVRS